MLQQIDMDSSHIFIAVMGTLGVGKSTAAKLLAEKFKAQLLLEQFADNPFLPLFYKDMPRWAFHSQTFFLLEKIRQLETVPQIMQTSSVIQDTPIYQDVFSYGKAQKELGNMDVDEWHLYCKLYERLDGYLRRPDLIVYLEASVDQIIERITQRGRTYENSISVEYLTMLTHLNQEWLKHNTQIPVCKIDTESLNIATNQKDQETFVSLIKEEIVSHSVIPAQSLSST